MSVYKDLGIALKAYRVAAAESIVELSNAIELDEKLIERIENGQHRPLPEHIELIARHFTLRSQEANRLLELAGYVSDDINLELDADFNIEDIEKVAETMVDPVYYTDTVKVVSNQFGVIINFVQTNGNNKPAIISRVGMSHEHAKSVIKVLQESIKRASNQEDQDPSS